MILVEYYYLDKVVGSVVGLSLDDKGKDVSVAFKVIYSIKDKEYVKDYIRCYHVKDRKKKMLLDKISEIDAAKIVDVYTIKNSAFLYRTEIDESYMHIALTLILSSMVVLFISSWVNT